RITPSVAEQEGQQTETEATGAPQKHHYTLNQQVGSITGNYRAITVCDVPHARKEIITNNVFMYYRILYKHADDRYLHVL
uniref:hypothetical protein n=1 Tax=Klebsiella pneumoniae TaxID=573 RepID=UPI002FF3DEA7